MNALWSLWNDVLLPAADSGLQRLLPEAWRDFRFMRYALLECLFLAPVCALMGVKVVNFRMAFFSDAISHSAFAGIAVGFLLAALRPEFDPRIAMIVFGLLVGLGIAVVRRRTDLSNDTVIGVFFSTVVAFGIAIITVGRRTGDFQRYLYGDILTLDAADLGLSALLAVLVLILMGCNFNRLTLIGLNDELAASRGIPVRLHDYLFAVLLALVVTASIRTTGILLVTAMLIVPAAAARNVARSCGGMFWWAMAVGLLSAVAGTLASFSAWFDNVGTGAAIVLAAAACFAVSLLLARR